MRKNPFIRWQLWALGGITLLLLYRVVAGPPPREGLVVLEQMEAKSLHHRSFEVDRTIQVAIEGKASFQNLEMSNGALAAFAWIINADTRELVWQVGVENTTRTNGTLAEIEDELRLDAGKYQLLFASFGDQLRGRRDESNRNETEWENDEREWYIILKLVEGKDTDVRIVHSEANRPPAFQGERLVWNSGPVENRSNQEFVFHVKERAPFKIRSTGEYSEDMHDFGFIENLLTDARVWHMTLDNSVSAGGVEENRRVSEEIYLDPGVYRAAYQTDATHAYGNWKGNPPFDPLSWGLTLTTRDTSDPIVAFDPWIDNEPAIEMMPNLDDQIKATTFRLTKKHRIVLYGMGEMKHSDRYDYGWIERSNAGASTVAANNNDRHPNADRSVWEMKYDASSPAGGDDSNRETLAFIDLLPDVYTMYYRTDGSHSYEDWSNGEPAHGDRWGIALFMLDISGKNDFQILEQLDLSEVEEEDGYGEGYFEEDAPDVEIAVFPEALQPPTPSTLNFDPSDIIVSLNKLGSGVEVREDLELQGWSQLRVVAVGEITTSGNRYDYGYIAKAGSGEVVWEMNLDNTQPAGGDEANRIFNGTIELSTGSYVVHFKTDATHAFGDFNTPPPAMPEAWGITIARKE